MHLLNEHLKTSEEWQKLCTIIILDPDGWDRTNYQYSWYEELIIKKEFEKRLCTSTIYSGQAIFNAKGDVSSIWRNENDNN